MDRILRITVLVVCAGTVAMCWLAISMIFSGNLHYLTEHSVDERLFGVQRRFNANIIRHFEDGSQNLGYSLVDREFENQIILPEEWNGEFDPVEIPGEIPFVPEGFLTFVQLQMCANVENVTKYVEKETSITTVFYKFDGRVAARIRADSVSC